MSTNSLKKKIQESLLRTEHPAIVEYLLRRMVITRTKRPTIHMQGRDHRKLARSMTADQYYAISEPHRKAGMFLRTSRTYAVRQSAYWGSFLTLTYELPTGYPSPPVSLLSPPVSLLSPPVSLLSPPVSLLSPPETPVHALARPCMLRHSCMPMHAPCMSRACPGTRTPPYPEIKVSED